MGPTHKNILSFKMNTHSHHKKSKKKVFFLLYDVYFVIYVSFLKLELSLLLEKKCL